MKRDAGGRLRVFGAACLFLSVVLTILPLSFSARAMELDGWLREKMWVELAPFTVIHLRDEPNCSVDVANIYVCFDEHNFITYIGCRFSHPTPAVRETTEDGSSVRPTPLSGISVQVEDADFLSFTAQNAEAVNGDAYRIEGAVASLSDTNTTAELLIGQKYGLRDPLHIRLRFYDADGIPSNAYSLSIPSPTPETAYATVRAPVTTAPPKTVKTTVTQTKTEKPTTTRRTPEEKTTVEKTTVEKTTAERVKEDRTTQEQTTQERTTAEKTVREKTTKGRTTKPPKTTKPKRSTEKSVKTTQAAQALTDSNELLQQFVEEQVKTRTALYIGVGVLIVAAFLVGVRVLRKQDE